jgi:hypothetical protein
MLVQGPYADVRDPLGAVSRHSEKTSSRPAPLDARPSASVPTFRQPHRLRLREAQVGARQPTAGETRSASPSSWSRGEPGLYSSARRTQENRQLVCHSVARSACSLWRSRSLLGERRRVLVAADMHPAREVSERRPTERRIGAPVKREEGMATIVTRRHRPLVGGIREPGAILVLWRRQPMAPAVFRQRHRSRSMCARTAQERGSRTPPQPAAHSQGSELRCA